VLQASTICRCPFLPQGDSGYIYFLIFPHFISFSGVIFSSPVLQMFDRTVKDFIVKKKMHRIFTACRSRLVKKDLVWQKSLHPEGEKTSYDPLDTTHCLLPSRTIHSRRIGGRRLSARRISSSVSFSAPSSTTTTTSAGALSRGGGGGGGGALVHTLVFPVPEPTTLIAAGLVGTATASTGTA
jgi:hypothetical protein